jgi:hypothetical protein
MNFHFLPGIYLGLRILKVQMYLILSEGFFNGSNRQIDCPSKITLTGQIARQLRRDVITHESILKSFAVSRAAIKTDLIAIIANITAIN